LAFFISLFVYLLGSVDFLLRTLGSDSHSAVLSRLHLDSHSDVSPHRYRGLFLEYHYQDLARRASCPLA